MISCIAESKGILTQNLLLPINCLISLRALESMCDAVHRLDGFNAGCLGQTKYPFPFFIEPIGLEINSMLMRMLQICTLSFSNSLWSEINVVVAVHVDRHTRNISHIEG